MDPVTIVVSALAAGASAGLKDTVVAAITDAYSGLKHMLVERYSAVSTHALERRPDSKMQKAALEESLNDAGAAEDPDLLAAAKALLAAIEVNDPDAAAAVGVDLSRIDASSIDIHDIDAAKGSTGVHADNVKVTGAMNISGVRAGGHSDHP